MNETERKTFEGWCILELMGHVKLGGYVTETTLAGAGMLRLDIPGADKPCQICGNTNIVKEGLVGAGEKCVRHETVYATQFIPPSTLYRMTPCSEEAARAVAAHNRPQPVTSWELPRLPGAGIGLQGQCLNVR